jgi:hypothetical protein
LLAAAAATAAGSTFFIPLLLFVEQLGFCRCLYFDKSVAACATVPTSIGLAAAATA